MKKDTDNKAKDSYQNKIILCTENRNQKRKWKKRENRRKRGAVA